MEAWVKVDQFGNTWTPLIFKGNGNPQQRTYSLWVNADGRVHMSTGDFGNQFVETAAGLVKAGEWHHVAGVIDRVSGTMRILVDGVERASGSHDSSEVRPRSHQGTLGAFRSCRIGPPDRLYQRGDVAAEPGHRPPA